MYTCKPSRSARGQPQNIPHVSDVPPHPQCRATTEYSWLAAGTLMIGNHSLTEAVSPVSAAVRSHNTCPVNGFAPRDVAEWPSGRAHDGRLRC